MRRRRLVLLAAAPVLGFTFTACPDDLDAEVDATMECTALDPETGEEIALRITVTSVEGDTANFDIEPVE